MEILFEDKDILVINKPSGLLVHTDGRSKEPTLADWVLENYPDTKEVGEVQVLQTGEEIKRPGIVHRLDRETSGVMLVAKTQEMFLSLKEQFQNQEISKEYRAFVVGTVKEDLFTIDRPIGRSSSDFRMWSAQRGAKGKLREAVTDIRVIERLLGMTYVSAFPKTGRTHQIRVHLKAIHHPILCDSLYGFKDTPCPPELGRIALHSFAVTFTHLSGKGKRFEAPIPEGFADLLTQTI